MTVIYKKQLTWDELVDMIDGKRRILVKKCTITKCPQEILHEFYALDIRDALVKDCNFFSASA